MKESVALVDYGSGNLRSVEKALQRAAADAGLAREVQVTSDPTVVSKADRVVLPGVGAFAACRAGVFAIDGLMEALEHAVLVARRPFLGVCVGMQLLAARGFEHGETPGFGWVPGSVRALAPDDVTLKIPHMGWNALEIDTLHPCLEAMRGAARDAAPHVYFVHGYAFAPDNAADRLATCDYGGRFSAAVGRDNILGVQFHPEKSQAAGLALLSAFLDWRP